MKQKIIIASIIFTLLALLTQGRIINTALSLMLVGNVPGTSIAIPFWAMMAIYCTIAALIVASYTESLIVNHRMRKATSKRRMPRRRYSHI
jgi:hypothetical protein